LCYTVLQPCHHWCPDSFQVGESDPLRDCVQEVLLGNHGRCDPGICSRAVLADLFHLRSTTDLT
jgi:hypothetical protein